MADDQARITTLEQQLLALQNQITAQTAQITAHTAQITAQAAAAPPQAQPGPFALSPALANTNAIDLYSASGIKLYKSIIAPLDHKFDGSAKEFSKSVGAIIKRKGVTKRWPTIRS